MPLFKALDEILDRREAMHTYATSVQSTAIGKTDLSYS